jgi:putative membrane protein
MSSDQASLLSALQSLTGAEFDRTYARQQLLAHRQAIAVEQSYASAGSDANLRDAAQSALPMIQHHLEMAEQMREALGGS